MRWCLVPDGLIALKLLPEFKGRAEVKMKRLKITKVVKAKAAATLVPTVLIVPIVPRVVQATAQVVADPPIVLEVEDPLEVVEALQVVFEEINNP